MEGYNNSVYTNTSQSNSNRDSNIDVNVWIERQRSETNQLQNRKKLIDAKELLKISQNRFKEISENKIDNHVTKFSFATKAGKSIRNPRKKNQDQYIIEPVFCGLRDVHFFGIWDGHGVNGKQVSNFIKQELPK